LDPIGSPNLDMRSFFLSYEDALLLYSREDIAKVRGWIDALDAECTSEIRSSRRRWWLVQELARLMAPEL
jgi:phosphatidylserine/phosphatidylglycerophosphate/cardiolipin synthase-like enzyme